jgi:hypothetical protein
MSLRQFIALTLLAVLLNAFLYALMPGLFGFHAVVFLVTVGLVAWMATYLSRSKRGRLR